MSVTPKRGLFESLNKAQYRAVSSQAPTLAILAGPGSGKTHTLTSRVVWLIDHVGLRPCDVLVATFTVKAANEMKTRIGSALGDGREKKIVLGTFHSIARRYLAAYGDRIGLDRNFAIADDSDTRGILQRICKRLDAPIEPAMARGWISKRKARGTSDEQTAKGKNGKRIESQALEQCFQEYQEHLKRSNLLDYDDLLVLCVELLRKFPSCVANVQAVLIDEYQDTNGVQYDLMKLFAQQQRKITVVGDPDQSIYGWRSAEIRNLHRLLAEYPGTDEVALEENYRSSSSILDTSLQVIQQDEERYQKVLQPVHARGTRPVLRHLSGPIAEADWIVSEMKRVQLMSGGMIAPNDIAILLRSASLSRHVEHALGREGVSYRMVGGLKFYERAEIKVILDYLRIIHQPDNNDALARILNKPKRGIGDVTIKSLLEESERNSMSLWKMLLKHCRGERTAKTTIRKQTEQKISGELVRMIEGLRSRLRPDSGSTLNLVEVIEKLLHDLRFQTYLEDTPEPETRWANVQEFVTLAKEFMSKTLMEEEEALPVITGLEQNTETDVLGRFLANVSLASDKQRDDKDENGKPLITISTIHAAKGLEWPVVFVPAVYKGSIPHVRSDDDAEERRLLFVAMTRAKSLLYLSHPQSNGNSGDGALQLSPFVSDLPSSHFLKKGPSFDRRIMMDVAKILGRELPSDQDIYKNMPLMEAIEDDRFPVDPTAKSDTAGSTGGIRSASSFSTAPYKRQKLQHASGDASAAPEPSHDWMVRPATTMEKAAFTIPQPTFTTAGDHHATATAAAAAAAAAAPKPSKPPPNPNRKQAPTRAPTQRSLLGFGYGVTNHDQSKTSTTQDALSQTSAPADPQLPKMPPIPQLPRISYSRGPSARPAPPSIDPGLAAHKVGSGKIPGKPSSNRFINEEEEGGEAGLKTPVKPYACFSSSPTKPPPGGAEEGKENQNQSQSQVVPPEEQMRPAASFHTTTTTAATAAAGRPLGWGGMGRGIHRPAPLVRDGITPLDRLRRPFKPPSKRI